MKYKHRTLIISSDKPCILQTVSHICVTIVFIQISCLVKNPKCYQAMKKFYLITSASFICSSRGENSSSSSSGASVSSPAFTVLIVVDCFTVIVGDELRTSCHWITTIFNSVINFKADCNTEVNKGLTLEATGKHITTSWAALLYGLSA